MWVKKIHFLTKVLIFLNFRFLLAQTAFQIFKKITFRFRYFKIIHSVPENRRMIQTTNTVVHDLITLCNIRQQQLANICTLTLYLCLHYKNYTRYRKTALKKHTIERYRLPKRQLLGETSRTKRSPLIEFFFYFRDTT